MSTEDRQPDEAVDAAADGSDVEAPKSGTVPEATSDESSAEAQDEASAEAPDGAPAEVGGEVAEEAQAHEVAASADEIPAAGEPAEATADGEDVGVPAAPFGEAESPATSVDFGELMETLPGSDPQALSVLFDLSLPVAIELGRTRMAVQDLLSLGRGSVVQLDRLAGEPVDVFVGDRRFAEGEVVVLGEQFGVRITRIIAGAIASTVAAAP